MVTRVTAVGVALALGCLSGVAGAQSSSAPAGLTENGRLLWHFEALLHDAFGNRAPFASSASRNTNFACAGRSCTPHAKWNGYSYTFADARESRFRLRSRTFPPGAFGNYPMPLRVNGLYIACNAAATTFLANIGGTAGFALECVRPSR